MIVITILLIWQNMSDPGGWMTQFPQQDWTACIAQANNINRNVNGLSAWCVQTVVDKATTVQEPKK